MDTWRWCGIGFAIVVAIAVTGAGCSADARLDARRTVPPVPAGRHDVPKPAGSSANLRILPWAGFTAAVTYSFDDAQPSQVEHYPDLDAVGVPLTFYITAHNVATDADAATWEAALANGHELGNHTMHHCHFDMRKCRGERHAHHALALLAPPPRSDTPNIDIDECTQFLIDRIGVPAVRTFAAPYGDTGYERDAEHHFFLARGVQEGIVTVDGDADPFNLPVRVVNAGERMSAFNADTDSVRARGGWMIFVFHSLLPTDAIWSAAVDIASVTGTMQYAKYLRDVWIDTVAHVGAYWLGQRTIAAVTPEKRGRSLRWSWTLPKDFPPGTILRVTVAGGTLEQNGTPLEWNGHGYYEIALDDRSLDWYPPL